MLFNNIAQLLKQKIKKRCFFRFIHLQIKWDELHLQMMSVWSNLYSWGEKKTAVEIKYLFKNRLSAF